MTDGHRTLNSFPYNLKVKIDVNESSAPVFCLIFHEGDLERELNKLTKKSKSGSGVVTMPYGRASAIFALSESSDPFLVFKG